MSNERKTPSNTWEIMLATRDAVGATEMQKIFSRGQTQINRYCQPPGAGDGQRNPLDRMQILFKMLAENGEQEVVRSAINLFAECIDCRLKEVTKVVPDKATVEEECLDDFPELVAMDALINRDEHPRVVTRQAEKAKGEIDETLASYMQYWQKKYGAL